MLLVNLLIGAVAAIPVQVKTLDGEDVRGELQSLSTQMVVLATEAGVRELPRERLVLLATEVSATAPSAAPAALVQLRDGSKLPVEQFTSAAGTATLKAVPVQTATEALELPIKAVRWVHFLTGEQDAKLAKQWETIAATKSAGDLLVVRKDDALDYLEGVIRDIDGELCRFELDGEVIPVKRAKVAGLVYAAAAAELPASVGTLLRPDGLRLEVRSLTLEGDDVRLETPAGSTHTVSLHDAVRFDFSSGKIVFLSDLEPEAARFTPLVRFGSPPRALLEYYTYRRDAGFDQHPLRIAGRAYGKGLALATRTELEYRLPGSYRLFRATVGIDEATRATGSVFLTVLGDQRELWSGEVSGADSAQSLELTIDGVRRLTIVADYGRGLDIGDRLILADAQVTK